MFCYIRQKQRIHPPLNCILRQEINILSPEFGQHIGRPALQIITLEF